MQVFLDLWGVLLDPDKMQREYGRRLGIRLKERFGGTEARWLQAHNVAWTEYVRATESTDWNRGSWAAAADNLDARFALALLEGAGIGWRPDDPAEFSRELEREIMSNVDARYPDARTAIERLRAGHHGVYVATQATESNARGALAGAGLLDSIDALFTGTKVDAPKSGRDYWERVLAAVRAAPRDCILVDDRIDYLHAATGAGFAALLLDREELYAPDMTPRFVRATLLNLAGLPHFVDTLAAEGGRPSP